MNKYIQASVVTIGAILLAVLSIYASDMIPGQQYASLSQSGATGCPAGMVLHQLAGGRLCVDQYEASPLSRCPESIPENELETESNLATPDCAPQSVSDVLPWRYVSLHQAKQLCARVDKRLPTPKEWYAYTLPLADSSACVTDESAAQPTGSTECTTRVGVADSIGNIWEWVDAEVVDGQYRGRTLPASGYVAAVDADGMLLQTTSTPQTEYGRDYAQTARGGVYGVVRGGFYGSTNDAGLYAQNLAVPLSLKTAGIGFRCVRSI